MKQEMKSISRFDKAFGHLGVAIARRRLSVLAALLLGACLSMYFASHLRIDNSFDTFFDVSDLSYQAYKDYQKNFGPDEVAYILYTVPGRENGIFDIDIMRKVHRLTEEFEHEVPFVREVTSLTNVEFIEAQDDLLIIHELGLTFPETQEELLLRRNVMLKKPIYYGGLFNKDVTHGAIILEMDRTSTDPLEDIRLDPNGGDGLQNLYPQVSHNKIEEIISRPEFSDIEFYLTGDVTMNNAYNVIIGNEAVMLTLVSLVLVAAISMLCFRMRLRGLFAPLSVVILGLIFTLGFMGLLKFKVGLLFLIVPTLLIAIGVAQSVHLLAEFGRLRSQGMEKESAIRATLEKVGVPCTLAALTTSAGFYAMSISKLEALAQLSTHMGVGVLITFVMSIVVTTLYMSFGSNQSALATTGETENDRIGKFLASIANFNIRHRKAVLAVSAVVFAISIAGISKLNIAFNFLEDFKDHVQFRKDTIVAEDIMGGLINVVYIFDTDKDGGIKSFDVLKDIEALQTLAEQDPLVKKTYSIVDMLKDINQSLNNGDPLFYKLPEDDAAIAQYLLLYELSGGEELDDYTTWDFSKTPLELRVEMGDSEPIEALVDRLDVYLQANETDNYQVQITGIGYLWVKMADYISDSQLWGYLFAFTMIAVILITAYQSIKVGLIAMIPNLAPVIVALGYMGWTGINLDYIRLLLATIAIGIAVDDTVHMVNRMRREFLECGNYQQAIEKSLTSVGRALVITTLVLTLSFLVYLISETRVLTNFGELLAGTVFVALVADIVLFPALILLLKPFGQERELVKAQPEGVTA